MKLFYILTITLNVMCTLGSPVYDSFLRTLMAPQNYYNAHSYQQPYQPIRTAPVYYDASYYPQYNSQQQYQQQRQAQPQHSRSYKDICHMVHTDGFTNPGNVPRCPY